MLERLAEVIFNGGAPIAYWFVHTYCVQNKLDSSNLRLLKICGISFFYIITIVYLFNRQ